MIFVGIRRQPVPKKYQTRIRMTEDEKQTLEFCANKLNKTKKNYKKHQKTLYKKISKDYYMQAVVSSKQVSNCGASPKQTQHFEMKKVLKKT